MTAKKKLILAISVPLLVISILISAFFVCKPVNANNEAFLTETEKDELYQTTAFVNDFNLEAKNPTFLSVKMLGSPVLTAGANNSISVSKTIQATVTPSTARNQLVDWAVSWEDPSHSGTVTDYVTVTPESSGSTKATVTCYQPFTGNAIVTVTTQESGFSADCVVSFIGYPSSLSVTTSAPLKTTDTYSIGINIPYDFTPSLDNVFHQVGSSFYSNLQVSIVAHGKVEIGAHEVYRSGGSNWLGVETVDLSTLQDKLIESSYTNNVLTVKALKVIESYYSSTTRMDGGRTICYNDQVKSIVEDCYFTVKFYEPNSGLSKEYKLVFDDTVVNGVQVTSDLKF